MAELELKKETALIEAILYLDSDPLDESSLCRISGLSRETVAQALKALEDRYGADDSGIELIKIGGGILISPKKEYW
ncbi:MAG: SMC-Scp complex subunit ScpB, partial [Treponema sp.]|nr:SMC-Scp complex subunit ScpB [Treponema sp.]